MYYILIHIVRYVFTFENKKNHIDEFIIAFQNSLLINSLYVLFLLYIRYIRINCPTYVFSDFVLKTSHTFTKYFHSYIRLELWWLV